jgi:hypothetical protein
MGQVLKDFLAGSALIVAGTVVGFLALVVIFILWLFLHVIGIVASALFFVLFFVFSIWLVGFIYRKLKEMKKGN